MKKLENSFAVTGFIGKDAEIRSFQTASVARFSIAISRAEKEGEETTYVSSFMGVEAWRKNEALDSFDVLKKGNLVTVEGYFKPEEWTDAESGAKRSRIVMVATKFYLAPEKEEVSFFILGTASHSNTVPTRISSFSKSSNEITGLIGLAL